MEKTGSIRNLMTNGIEMSNQAIEGAKTMYDDIEMTTNALLLQKLSEMKSTKSQKRIKRTDNTSTTSFRSKKRFLECVTKIKKKLKMKTKKGENQRILSSNIKSVTCINSYECRVKYLAAKMSDKRVLHINVMLIDEDTNRNEILPFEFNMRDKILVKELMKKIPQFATDPVLKNKSYRCLCLDNSFTLEYHEPLQSYFLPSKENQFAIAVPVGKACKSIAELAMPIIYKTRRESITMRPTESFRESLNLLKGKKDKNTMLPKLLQVAQCDSMQSANSNDNGSKVPPTEIHIPEIVYMIMAVMFIYVMHGSSNEKISCG